ncbi:hypothetical protein [Amycolatopsis tolypomycina]|uniref:hypothetical protein n=1 Tax=Amycolatopsis tolypomycina TaxID=208445 RepID=UPI0033AD1042
MGILLDPTPEMGTWSVEVFMSSACLRSAAPADCVDRDGTVVGSAAWEAQLPVLDPGRRPAVFEVPAGDLQAVIAALDQVLAEPLYFDHVQHGDLDLGCWGKPVVENGWLSMRGPVLDAVVRVGCRSVELSYSHVAELRYHLVDFLHRGCPGKLI